MTGVSPRSYLLERGYRFEEKIVRGVRWTMIRCNSMHVITDNEMTAIHTLTMNKPRYALERDPGQRRVDNPRRCNCQQCRTARKAA